MRYGANDFLGEVLLELSNHPLDDEPEWYILHGHQESNIHTVCFLIIKIYFFPVFFLWFFFFFRFGFVVVVDFIFYAILKSHKFYWSFWKWKKKTICYYETIHKSLIHISPSIFRFIFSLSLSPFFFICYSHLLSLLVGKKSSFFEYNTQPFEVHIL